MRISPVHGDQWPVAALHSPLPPAEPSSAHTAAPAVAQVSASGAGARSGQRSGEDHRHSQRQAVFDPPLIAQRAVLGLPVGTQIADYAQAHDLPFTTVSRAVDLAMPVDRPHPGDLPAA